MTLSKRQRCYVLGLVLLPLVITLFIITGASPITVQREPNMFDCSQLKHAQYPVLSAEAESYFQQAYQQENASGPRDYVNIAALYQQAADLGHWKAMNNLFILYIAGLGVEANEDKTLALIEQMQQYDIPEAYNAMSYAYEKGLGRLRKSKTKAKEYHAYRLGAKMGCGSCIRALAYAYKHQTGYPTFDLHKDAERGSCLYRISGQYDDDPELRFPDLDERCPATVAQPSHRD